MEATREIYWNIGHGTVAFMYLLAVAAIAVMALGFRERLALWRKGRPLDRSDHPRQRLAHFIADTLSQRKVLRMMQGGLPHAIFFWGFLLLFIGTVLVMLQADLLTPLFSVSLLSGDFYRYYSLVLDLAGLIAMLALAVLAVRRFILRPSGLESTPVDVAIHLLLMTILLTGFLIEGARMAVTELPDNPSLATWSPVGLVFARLFSGMTEATARGAHKALWLLHLVAGLGFLALIPRTKLRHLVTTSAGSLLEPHEPKGTLSAIDLEDEIVEQFGASAVGDLSWKDLFDTDACMQCGRCQQRCPAYLTGKPLSPMKVINGIGELAATEGGNGLIAKVSRDAIWSCTTCRACEESCPASIEHIGKIIEMRRSLVLMEGEFPSAEARRACEAIEVTGNPFGLSHASRGGWAKGLPVSLVKGKCDADILYFTGCYAAYDPRNRKVAESFVRICEAAGVTVAILGGAERCCGEPARKLGNEYLYRMVAESNIEAIRASGARRVVTACPHCFNTFARDYRELGLDVPPVEHHSTFIADLINAGKLKLKPECFVATLHDSCYLARYRDIVDEPQVVVQAAGGELVEMKESGKNGFCCGAGGGRIFAEEKFGTPIADERLRHVLQTGASTLVSACPFCLSMFEDSLKRSDARHSIEACDLAEIVARRIKKKS